jgi:GNAT superfamily N-acetyltransferase
MDLTEPVITRLLTIKDLDSVSEIDISLLGRNRKEYWEHKLERAEASGVPSLAAEIDGRVIGFILGSAIGWEYGIPENVGWVDTLGVVKEWQGKGISELLVKEIYAMFQELGKDKICVFVDWKKWDLLQFFDKVGFVKGDMISLELKL